MSAARRAGASRRVALLGAAWLLLVTPVAGQDARQPSGALRVQVTVDYVSADGVYMGVGADAGAVLGDTVPVFASADATSPRGSVVFTSVTRRRSVVSGVAGAPLRQGDVVWVLLTPPPEAAAQVAATTPSPTSAGTPASAQARVAADPGARVSGRLSFDIDARTTRTAWAGDLFGETQRRFATPTTRLSLTASELPGGLELRANLRAAYRYDQLSGGPPPMSVRAYEAAAVKTGRHAQFMIGRFSNPYETYSAYWDGALIRVGGTSGPGLGVVAGFEPTMQDEGFSSTLPKVTGFADFSARGRGWRYDTDVSVHLLRPEGSLDQGYAGWSQRLALGPLDLSQRLRLDGGVDGRPLSVGDARMRAGLDVAGPLRIRATYGRARTTWVPYDPAVPQLQTLDFPLREEMGLGADLRGRRASLSIDGDRTTRDGTDAGLALSANASMRMGSGRLSVSGRRWTRETSETLGISPGLSFPIGGSQWRVGYRYYRIDSSVDVDTSHAGEIQTSFDLGRDLSVTFRAEQMWGGAVTSTRVRLGVWRSF